MKKIKLSKKFIVISAIILVVVIVLNFLLCGINIVPRDYRRKPVSFLTPNLTWDSKPSDVMLKYGLPKDISGINDITGERGLEFDFIYNEKPVLLSVDNGIFINGAIHRYCFDIKCKTPEEASAYFDECHKNIMNFHSDNPDFAFRGTTESSEYEYTDGSPCSYSVSHENDVEKVYIVDEYSNEIPLEEAENVVTINIKENTYRDFQTVGTHYTLVYYEGEATVTLIAEILY